MRNLKRALSLAMASVMLVGTMVVGSSASYVDVASEHNTEAIEVLQAVGIMTGDEKGNFNPDANVTRNEMAVIMCNLMDYVVSSYKGTAPFTDVPDWAADYVAACYTNSIVSGVSATQYNGDSPVTTGQAALMLMKALGYFKYQGDFADDWLVETTKLGTQSGIFDGVDNGAIEPLTRNQVAQMILNALEADSVEASSTSGVTIIDGNLVAGRAIYDSRTGTDTKFTKISKQKHPKYTNAYTIQLGEELYKGDLEKSGAKDSFGRPATQWKYKGNEIGTYGHTPDHVLVVAHDYIGDEKYDGKDLLKVIQELADNDDFRYAAGDNSTDFYFNGNGSSAESLRDRTATYGTTYELFMVDNEPEQIDRVVAYSYNLDKITNVDTNVSSGDAKKGVTAYISFENAGEDIESTDIAGYDADTYVKDAYVALIAKTKNNSDEDKEVIGSFIPETVEDSIGTRKNEESITVDGQRYYVSRSYTRLGSDFVSVKDVSLKSDDTYRVYLDENNRVLAIEGIQGTASLSDVYYVDKVWDKNDNVAGDTVKSYYAQVVSLEDGTKVEYKLEDGHHKTFVYEGTEKVEEEHNLKTDLDDVKNSFEGQLVTISDKKVDKSKTDDSESKANNDKWNLNLWDSTKDWTVRGERNYNEELKKSTRTVSIGGETYRLGSSTVYLFLEKGGSDLSVSRYVGGVAFDKGANWVKAIKDKDSAVASYVLFQVDKADQAAEYSEDVIFLYSASKEKGDGYRDQEVYLPDGSVETWQIAENEYDGDELNKGRGFFTYSTNDDGYYELKEAEEMKSSKMTDKNGLDWASDKQEGVLNAWIFDNKDNLFEDELTITKKDIGRVANIDVSNATFKDVRSKDDRDPDKYNEYKSVLNSLGFVQSNLGSGEKLKSVELWLNVSKDGAVTIFLTSAQLNPSK